MSLTPNAQAGLSGFGTFTKQGIKELLTFY